MNEILISFTPKFLIYVPCPNLIWSLSLNNNPSHIYHLVSPFSPPTPFLDRLVPHISLAHQMIVTKSAGSPGVGGTGNLAFESFGPGGSSVVIAVHLMPDCMRYSAEHFVFDDHHPIPILCFYKWGNLVPIHTSLSALELQQHGDCCIIGLQLNLYHWGRSRCRGLASLFLI